MADTATIHDKVFSRLQTPQVVDVAADLAHYILQEDPERLEHSRAVADRAKDMRQVSSRPDSIRSTVPSTCGQQAGRESYVDSLRTIPAVASSPTNGAWTTPWRISNFRKTC